MSEFLFTGARVIDPSSDTDTVKDILVRDGLIADGAPTDAAERIDCAGLILCPGFVDLHTHLREPGREDAETIESGTRAAARGGYTAVSPMANTNPVQDNAAVVEQVVALGQKAGRADVFPVGAITQGLAGERLAEFGEMANSVAKVNMFSDDGKCVGDAALMRRAFEYARAFDAIIANHAEDVALSKGGQMHEGALSQELGLRGIPAEAEEITVARDLALARLTGARYHVLHVSTAAAVDLVRAAKAAGTAVTAEVTPHHLSLTHEEIATAYDPVFKVAPPLRTKADIEALKQGLADGTIDCVATDHAPHSQHDKEREFDQAPCGMLGLETALSVLLTECADLGLPRIVDALSTAPARIRSLDDHGSLAVGTKANITVFDPAATWEVVPETLASKSRNTPFAGRRLNGRVIHTMYAGRFTVREGRDHG